MISEQRNHTKEGRYISPSELDQIDDLIDMNKRPSLFHCIAMIMELRDARGWVRLDGAEKKRIV